MGAGPSKDEDTQPQPQPQPQPEPEPKLQPQPQPQPRAAEKPNGTSQDNNRAKAVTKADDNTKLLEDDRKQQQICNSNGKSKEKTDQKPYKHEAMIKQADSSIGQNSSTHGVFLNQNKLKYWVDKKSGSKSFMLFARSLNITWAQDDRYWRWTSINDTSNGDGNGRVEAAELVNVCWLEINARFDTSKLSPSTLYHVALVVMLKEPAYGWETPVNLRLLLPNGVKQQHTENLMLKLRPRLGEWIEIPVGEFTTSTSPEMNNGQIEISMFEYEGGEWKKGLVVKGITIRPKN